MATLINNGERLSSVRAKLNAAVAPFENRAEFEGAQIPSAVQMVSVIDNGSVVQLIRSSAGDWTSGDGSKWVAAERVYDVEKTITAQLVIPDGTRIDGDLRLRRDYALTGTVLVIGDDVTITGRLIFSDPHGVAVNPRISIGENFKAGGIEAISAVQNTATLVTMRPGFDIGSFKSRNFARPLSINNGGAAERGRGGYIGSVVVDTFIRGISASLIDGWRIDTARISGRAASASFQNGHNGLLVLGCNDWSIGALEIEGAAEHAVRIGGSADSAGSNRWVIDRLHGANIGGAVLKLNDTNAYSESWTIGDVIGSGSYTDGIGRNRELLRITRSRNGNIGKAIARKLPGADYSCFGPLAIDFIGGLTIGMLDCEGHRGETVMIRGDQDGAAPGPVHGVHIGYLRSDGGSDILSISTAEEVGNIHIANGYFGQDEDLIKVSGTPVITGPIEVCGYAAASRAVVGVAAGQVSVDLRLPDGRSVVGDALGGAHGTHTLRVAPLDPGDVSGADQGGLTLQSAGGAPAEGLLGAAINADRPGDTTRRGGAIAIKQTGPEARQTGWAFYSAAGSEASDAVTEQFYQDHLGNLHLVRAGAGPVLTSPNGLSTSMLALDNNARLNLGGAPLVSQLHFASRSAFQTATIPAWCKVWIVEHAGMALRYVRTTTAWRAAITSANGVHGIPADVCTAEHYGAVRDGVANDAAAINAAVLAFGYCWLGSGTYAVGDTIDLQNQSLWGAGRHATVLLGLSSGLAAAEPIVAIGKQSSLRGMTVKYDAIAGTETRGQRVAVQTYSIAGAEALNRASDLSDLIIGRCGTGISDAGQGYFNVSFNGIWVTEFAHRGFDAYGATRTGNSYDNLYIGSPGNPHTPLNCINLEGREASSFFGQINLEHTACTGSVARFYGQAGHAINSLHIEGTDLLTANTAIIEVDSALLQIGGLNVLNTRQSADNVSLFWLRDPRSADLQEALSVGTSWDRSRLSVGNLYMHGLASPHAPLYPAYPSGRRGLANIAGWKFVRCADTTRGWDVEVGNVAATAYGAHAADEPIFRYAPSRYSDAANVTVLRWGRKGPLGGPNPNLISNGDFSVWTATSATATGSTVQGPTGWFAATATGSLTISRQTEGVGLAFREFLRISNVGTSGNYHAVYTDIPKPQRGIGEKITISFDARASVAGRRLEHLVLEINNPGGSPAYYYNQLVAGSDAQIQFTTDFQRYEITDAAIPSGAITAWGSSPTFRLAWQITDAGGTRETQLDIDNVKLEIGAVATHMAA